MSKKVFKTLVAVLAIAAAATGPARAQIGGTQIDLSGESEPLSSDMTCTYFLVVNQGTLTVNQGVTLTLNCEEFDLKNNSAIHLHGTMTGSVSGEADWGNNSYIDVYLSDGAKYTVAGLECMDGDGYLRYHGYDAATDGNGTVSVTNGSTTVTANTTGYKTTTYTFTATPASGYHFVNWTKGAGGEELGTDASIDVTCQQNGWYQVYANFESDAPSGSATPEPETLLTTITATAKEQASYSTANVATVSFSNLPSTGANTYGSDYLAAWGWYGYGFTATVTPAEGYTITKCIFYDDANRTATDSESPFVVETTEEDKTPRINGTPIDGGNMQSKGIKKIEVYGYVTPAGPQMRTLTGVPQGWQVQAGAPLADVDSNADGSYSIEAGQPVRLVPSAEDKPRVKSVTLEDNSTPPAVYLEATTTAWADGINYAVPAGGLTYGDAVTVSGNVTLTLTEGTTLTLNKGISMAEGATLTVTGPGTLVVNGAKGNDGASGWEGSNGGNGGVAISGNIIVQGGATVTATGGNGGNGGYGDSQGGNGGNGGVAFAGTLTYKSGTVTANGGSAGSGGGSEWDENGHSGSAGKAFANDVDFTQTTGYSVTNGTSTIGSVLNQTKVVISGGTPIPTGN